MARHRRRRRNPTGTLLVNSGRRGRRRAARRNPKSKRAVKLAALFSRMANPRKRRHNPRRRHGKRRNPLLVSNPRRHRASKRRSMRRNPRRYARRHSKRRNPLLVNPRRRRASKRRHNPRRRYGSKRRRNPLLVNPRRRGSRRRRNPAMFHGILSKGQSYAKKVPLVGGLLATMIGGVGAALAGAVGVLPTDMALPYVSSYLPAMVRPYAYSLGGLALSAAMHWLPSFPYKDKLQTGMIFAGGAVDMYRYRRGHSMDLAGDDYAGDDLGDAWGDSGEQFAEEYADADLQDANYCGDDLSGEEMETAALGRSVWRRRYRKQQLKKRASSKDGDEQSDAEKRGAGLPGHRWKWLIYWIGFDNFQALSQMDEAKRKQTIAELKQQAHHNARLLLNKGVESSVEEAETAGLLVL